MGAAGPSPDGVGAAIIRWRRTARNGGAAPGASPLTLTYGFVPDGTHVGASGVFTDSAGASNLHKRLDLAFGSRAAWTTIIHDAFEAWGTRTGVRFVFEPADDGAPLMPTDEAPGAQGTRADIRIAAKPIDGASSNNLLAFNYFPEIGDMVLDSDNWRFFIRNSAAGYPEFRSLIIHEIGHALGLAHSCPLDRTKVMEAANNPALTEPALDELIRIHAVYGDGHEPDGTRADATPIHPVSGQPLDFAGLSLHESGDVDIFAIEVSDPVAVTVTASPAGGAYLRGVETRSGSCVPQLVDAIRHGDLAVEILAPDDTVVALADDFGPGNAEAIAPIVLDQPGIHLIRVTTSSLVDVQPYTLSVSSEPAVLVVPTDHPTIQDAVRAAIDGFVIEVMPGRYEEIVNLFGKRLRIVAPGGPAMTSIVAPPGSFPEFVVGCVGGEPPGTTIEGFSISTERRGRSEFGLDGGAAVRVFRSDLTIRQCRLHDAHLGVWAERAGVLVESCLIDGIAPTPAAGSVAPDAYRWAAIWSTHSLVSLTNSLVRDNLPGIQAEGAPPLLADLEGAAVVVWDDHGLNLPGSDVRITNSSIIGNEQLSTCTIPPGHGGPVSRPCDFSLGPFRVNAGLAAFPSTWSVTLDSTLLHANVPSMTTTPSRISFSWSWTDGPAILTGTGNGAGDPGLRPDLPWRPRVRSPLVDGGNPSPLIGAIPSDIEGLPRISNGRIDIGCAELDPRAHPYPGSGRGLRLLTGPAGQVDDNPLKTLPGGADLEIVVQDASAAFTGSPLLVAGELAPSWPLAGDPSRAFHLVAPLLLNFLPGSQPFPVMPISGEFRLTLPAGVLTGPAMVRVQAASVTRTANPEWVFTDAHVITVP